MRGAITVTPTVNKSYMESKALHLKIVCWALNKTLEFKIWEDERDSDDRGEYKYVIRSLSLSVNSNKEKKVKFGQVLR